MTEYTRPATWDDVKLLARLLNEAGVEYALVGGYAVAAHGFNRFSEDIDIFVNPDVENSRRWIRALTALPDQAARELLATPDVFAMDRLYAVRINDAFTVDILPDQAGRAAEGSDGCRHPPRRDRAPGGEGRETLKRARRPNPGLESRRPMR